MKLLIALTVFLLMGLCSGCAPSASQQSAQAPPPSLSTPAPVVVITSAPIVPSATTMSSPPTSTSVPLGTSVAVPSRPEGSSSSAPVLGAAGSFSSYVADFATKIRASGSQADAEGHIFVLQGVESGLGSGARQDAAKAAMYAHGQSALQHLQAAANFKAASFSAWNSTDAKSKLLNMDSELLAAQNEAAIAQKMAEGKTP